MAKILIVDDNTLCARALSLLLAEMGHDAACITGGIGVLDDVRQASPDLLVLDVQMPGMDGLEILRQLRQDQKLEDLPVLMFSGERDNETQAEAYRLGALDFIIKGWDWKTLQARLAAHLSSCRSRGKPRRSMIPVAPSGRHNASNASAAELPQDASRDLAP